MAVVSYKLSIGWLKTKPLCKWQQDFFAVEGERWHGPNFNAATATAAAAGQIDADDSSSSSSSHSPPPPSPDALLVLGCRVNHLRRVVSAPLEARLCLALARAVQDPGVRVVVLSGGANPTCVALGLPSEAQVMAEWFQKHWTAACPEPNRTMPRLILEHTSTNTLQNAIYSLATLLREEEEEEEEHTQQSLAASSAPPRTRPVASRSSPAASTSVAARR